MSIANNVRSALELASRKLVDPWSQWPIFDNNGEFRTRNFNFKGSVTHFDGKTSDAAIAILKNREFINLYRELFREFRARHIFEIGFFQGGMALFLMDMTNPDKIVGIDRIPPTDSLLEIIRRNGLTDRVKLYGSVSQNDVLKIKRILNHEFGDTPLDLIIDDCSHEYENSKNCFEEYFGCLRPGGKYVIEDWGWLHWPGDRWQTQESNFWGQTPMTTLIFELVMVVGTYPHLISRVDVVSNSCAIITRGPGLGHKQRIDLSESRLTSGRAFNPF